MNPVSPENIPHPVPSSPGVPVEAPVLAARLKVLHRRIGTEDEKPGDLAQARTLAGWLKASREPANASATPDESLVALDKGPTRDPAWRWMIDHLFGLSTELRDQAFALDRRGQAGAAEVAVLLSYRLEEIVALISSLGGSGSHLAPAIQSTG